MMTRTPSINRFLFTFYAILTAGLFLFSLVSPSIRQTTDSPVRGLLPEPEPVEILVWYSTEKEALLNEVVPLFETSDAYRTESGRGVKISMRKMGSHEVYLNVLNKGGTEQPTLISPAGSLQIAILQDQSVPKYGGAIVDQRDRANCRSVVETPLVLAAWQERGTALWGSTAPEQLWHELNDALINGWGVYGHPEWESVKFGHTNPLSSNSGFMTILLMTYGYYGKTGGLTSADLDNPDYQNWFLDLERAVGTFGNSTGTYMVDMITYGPSQYDIVAVYEATALAQAENALGRHGGLQVYYPPATVMSDHPFCVLDADWVTAEQAEAARLFIDYLESDAVQRTALLNHGFRPVNSAISLTQDGSPFNDYASNGFSVSVPNEVEVPDGTTLDKLLTFWSDNLQ